MLENLVTASQAQRKWSTKIIGKVSSRDYELGAVRVFAQWVFSKLIFFLIEFCQYQKLPLTRVDDADMIGRDERREFWREGWRRCARFGIQGLPIPAEFGGRGRGLPETIAAMEGLGYGCPDNGLIFAMNASMWTVAIPRT